MHIVVVGLNHKSAPIALRERLAFRPEQLAETFGRLQQAAGLREAAILSTCNRVEIYAGAPALEDTIDRLHRFLGEHSGVAPEGLAPSLYSYTEPESVRHLFSVASGLDSMVLGEGEIQHQVKHAYERARDHGATGKLLNTLFQRALNAAKAVRSQTAIGRGCTSIGSVAVELSEKIFGCLSRANVLLIGAGKIGELTLKRLSARGVQEIRILNRSAERAKRLAADYGARAVSFGALAAQLADVDILISSTSAPGYLLDRSGLAATMRQRHQRPLCIVDLGVPRNVEPEAGGLDSVYLFNVDDLQGLVQHSHEERRLAIAASQAIIDRKVERFLIWWRGEWPVASGECQVDSAGCSSSLVTRHSSL
jgi:glutamyl-tRNA reductase